MNSGWSLRFIPRSRPTIFSSAQIEKDVLPHCAWEGIAVLAYGAICRGLLSGRMNRDTKFEGDDLRRTDPKFQPPRFASVPRGRRLLDQFAQKNYGKRVIHLALRWVLDQPGVTSALWGARHPRQLDPVGDVMGWTLDDGALRRDRSDRPRHRQGSGRPGIHGAAISQQGDREGSESRLARGHSARRLARTWVISIWRGIPICV